MNNIQVQSANKEAEQLIEILRRSPLPLSTRELGVRLRLRHFRLADYEISGVLRGMFNEGQVVLQNGRWAAPSTLDSTEPFSTSHVSLPTLSDETLALLGLKPSHPIETGPKNGFEWTEADHEKTPGEASSGRWDTFRKLLGYYRQCIRNEEGADASAFQNEHGKRFIYLRKSGPWYPRPGFHWRTTIPIGRHFTPLLNMLPNDTDEHSLVIGYPVQAYYKEKEDEPNVAIIRPVFFFTVEPTISGNGLSLSCENPKPEINLGWLEYAFPRKPEQQRSFLSACGFINRWRPNDEAPGLEKGELPPSLENLVAALAAFMSGRVKQPLTLHDVSGDLLREPFETGIYNRAVLMLAKQTKYTVTLLKELVAIEKMPDKFLDLTALRHIFARNRDSSGIEKEEILHEAIVADTTLLNAEQRQATASLLTQDITVVTGPPGTGKSQVVSSAVANARLQAQTVLFASRNHKAIDAVMGRLCDKEERPLIVRTNSKDDPNLNVTFAHAIRDMLAEQGDAAAGERLKRVTEELHSLLEDRGIQAVYAHQAEEAGMALGELEEQMSYLARDFPVEMASFLNDEPEKLSTVAVEKTIGAVKEFDLRSSNSYFGKKILDFFRAFFFLRKFRQARSTLLKVPGAPKLPAFPTPVALKSIQSEIPLLEKTIKYAQLRIKCRFHETRINELPDLESATQSVADISRRIAELSSRAITLDLLARRGLPANVDREELNGLRAALNAMRTGLTEGTIRVETIRVLEKRTPHILHAFPCWAVTNLSAGSRIPFAPAIFDLAIVDEASQSDIPSAIPILFRARRAGVVGDPFQLTHTSRLSAARDTMLRRQVAMKRVEDVRFAYTESSLYDLFAGTRNAQPIFLNETYRSAKAIANYSNSIFYSGRLRVATDTEHLIVPNGMSPGIHWTEVIGEVKSGGGSGCYCVEEVGEVVHTMRAMLLENNFRGSVGVVTPFRQQANRLRDALFESESRFYDALTRAQTHVDTAHGFQGDERDVMIFSLCAGPDMPRGSRSFLRETGNLFNVAVSRARAVIHVIGNRDWAKRCGIPHIEKLTSNGKRRPVPVHKGPWHPHESPWEENLFKALVEAGLEPRPQHPVSSRRLDMALIRTENKPIKIDIEVDGDCHRSSDGTRKRDDLWRDIQLQGMGWKVMRFWTYQLRENMAGSVDKIMEVWKSND